MRDHSKPIRNILPYSVPDNDGALVLLRSIRRMGCAGINDAHAANALIGAFGLSFRRPLVLMRALMAELSRASTRSIIIAPLCCVRMTSAESMLVVAIATANESPQHAHDLLSDLCGVPTCLGLLSSAQAVAQAFADLGRPIDAV